MTFKLGNNEGIILSVVVVMVIMFISGYTYGQKGKSTNQLNLDNCLAFKEMWDAREPYLVKTISNLQSENYKLRDICVETLLNASKCPACPDVRYFINLTKIGNETYIVYYNSNATTKNGEPCPFEQGGCKR